MRVSQHCEDPHIPEPSTPSSGNQGQNARLHSAPAGRHLQITGDQRVAAEAEAGYVDGEPQLNDNQEEIGPWPSAMSMIETKPQVERHSGAKHAAEANRGPCHQ